MGNITYIGHHGTSRDNAKRIIEINFSINYRHTGWLGKGVYFFEGNTQLARDYAETRHPGKIIKVIECSLDVPKANVFDTTDQDDQKIFHDFREELKRRLIEKGTLNIRAKNSDDFDGKVYDIITKAKNIVLIRAATFTPSSDDREYQIPKSKVPNGIELCLKSTNYVKDKYIYDN